MNHKNEITSDNRAENLEVCDQSYNTTYGNAIEKRMSSFKLHGNEPYRKRLDTLKKNGSCRAEIPVVIKNEIEEKPFKKMSEAAKYLKCSVGMISSIWTGRLKTVHGYKIERVE